VILRILGEGQFEVADANLEELNRLDDNVQKAVQASDHDRFAVALEALLRGVRSLGSAVPPDYLGPSELVLPGPDSSLEDVRAMLDTSEEGLIPG
jgi:hypothetical protein